MMLRKLLILLPLAFPFSAFAQPSSDWETPLRASLEKMAATLTETLKPWTVPAKVFRIAEYGAIGDATTVNTAAIQKAIDACTAAGGGTVMVEKGDYVTGTIVLKSGVMLEIAKDAKLLGSLNLADYPDHVPARITVMDTWMKMKQSLIYAEDCERIGIKGAGEIDGRGTQQNFPGKNTIAETPGRPFMIRILDSRKVVIDGITLQNPACWTQNYLGCDDLIIQGVTVDSQVNWNNDAFDIDGCRNVIVRNCSSLSVDDGLCFKGAGLRAMENVLVENCEFRTPCNAIKFGTDSQGDFRNFLIRNVKIGGGTVSLHKNPYSISGISLQSVDGGTIENILIQNTQMNDTLSPFCLRLGDRGRVKPDMAKPKPGIIRNIILERMQGTGHGNRGSIISGIPGATIKDVIFRDINLTVSGGGTEKDAKRDVPELIAAYPDAFSFGKTVPAYGFWIRHAENITFDHVDIALKESDARPAFIAGVDTNSIQLNGKPVLTTTVEEADPALVK